MMLQVERGLAGMVGSKDISKTPNVKYQQPNKHQTPARLPVAARLSDSEFGIYLEFDAWRLGLIAANHKTFIDSATFLPRSAHSFHSCNWIEFCSTNGARQKRMQIFHK